VSIKSQVKKLLALLTRPFLPGYVIHDQNRNDRSTILRTDVWNCYNADNIQGERRAAKEFVEQNKHIASEGWFPYSHTGQSFIVYLNN
jgi:hypothetical protein